jgi:hypothetical protein
MLAKSHSFLGLMPLGPSVVCCGGLVRCRWPQGVCSKSESDDATPPCLTHMCPVFVLGMRTHAAYCAVQMSRPSAYGEGECMGALRTAPYFDHASRISVGTNWQCLVWGLGPLHDCPDGWLVERPPGCPAGVCQLFSDKKGAMTWG